MEPWMLILTLIIGDHQEQKKIPQVTIESCHQAGYQWFLEQQEQYGKSVNAVYKCKWVDETNLYGPAPSGRLPWMKYFHTQE